MKKCKTDDGYEVYQVRKGRKWESLASTTQYQKDIDDVMSELEGLMYDSMIIIFGIDTGAYLELLAQKLCPNNRVVIFEPNKQIYESYAAFESEQIKIVFYDPKKVKPIFLMNVNFLNYDRLFLHAFGRYEELYPDAYQDLIENMENAYINASSCLGLADRFKDIFLENMLSNLQVINNATPLNHYVDMHKNIPGIVVSAGPSLEQNIKDMLRYKDQVEKCFIITGSRTVGALVKAGIMPDMIVSVDPVDANYEMMANYLDLKVPMAFYEYSNKHLLRDYQGEKVYIATLFSRIIEEMHSLRGVYLGGSVAHSCTDIAYAFGCDPIIFMGQDLAYTKGKHHADEATYEYDEQCDHNANLPVVDVYGNTISTTLTLDLFRKNLETYIEMRKKQKPITFINCGEGAAIKGAPHKSVERVFRKLKIKGKKCAWRPYNDISLDEKIIIENVAAYIERSIQSAEDGIEICTQILEEGNQKSLMEVEDDDLDLQRILYVLDLVDQFETSDESGYLGGYFNRFMHDIKEKKFKLLAQDFEVKTSDLQYQAECFKGYFEEMKKMLEQVQSLLLEVVTQ